MDVRSTMVEAHTVNQQRQVWGCMSLSHDKSTFETAFSGFLFVTEAGTGYTYRVAATRGETQGAAGRHSSIWYQGSLPFMKTIRRNDFQRRRIVAVS